MYQNFSHLKFDEPDARNQKKKICFLKESESTSPKENAIESLQNRDFNPVGTS